MLCGHDHKASKCHSVHFVVYSAVCHARRVAFVLPRLGPSPGPRRRAARAMSPGPEMAGSWNHPGKQPSAWHCVMAGR